MPLIPSPPYGSSTLEPRNLVRWNDVNYEGNTLGRFNTFITIPSFGPIIHPWNGYSEIVGAFYFQSPNNFSLVALPNTYRNSQNSIPNYLSSLNCLLVIAFLDLDNQTVVRYKLNVVGETLFFNIPLYTNQVIRRNFRIEIWNVSTDNAQMLQSSPPLWTSVLGDIDTRYGVDTSLSLSQYLVTNFSFQQDPVNLGFHLPLTWPGYSGFIPQYVNVNGIIGQQYLMDQGLSFIVDGAFLLSNQGDISPGQADQVGVPIIDLQTKQIVYVRVINQNYQITNS